MDFSALLLFPIGAIVAFAMVIGAAIIGRPSPRLIWPSLLSTLLAALVLLRVPQSSEFGLWLVMLIGLATSAAVGTVFGATLARVAIRLAGKD